MGQPRTIEPSDRLVVGSEIGSGAIARVVRIADRVDGRVYAGKILHARHERDEAARGRFVREAELAAGLRHENLITVFGITEIDGHTALLMELVEGTTLATHLATQGRLEIREVTELARGIAAGLSFAHAKGVIHRDLKPANVLLAPSPPGFVPKIADFGMARAASFADADRRALTVLGTPPYMAPECLEPLAVDPRTDLYALGCIIHEMIAGHPPYGGPTPMAVLDAHRNAPIPPLREDVPVALRELVARLLAKAPGDRPQSAAAVVDALRTVDATPGNALAPRAAAPTVLARVVTAAGACAGCGGDILPEVRVCFTCGLVQVALERGPMSVFVVGPGRIGDKLDSARRDGLAAWLRANEAVGLDPSRIEQRIPRLPFPLVTGVSRRSAATLLESLDRLGLRAESRVGGGLSHEALVRSALKITGRRVSIVGAVCGIPVMVNPLFGLAAAVPALAVAFPIILGVTLVQAKTPSVTNVARRRDQLPPQLQARIDGLGPVVESIGERRHREALRAVVKRVLSLTLGLPPAERIAVDAEMARGIDLASTATRRMDELDRIMGRPDFDPADPRHRGLMKERDTWSARLLDLTATLDALDVRRAAAEARRGDTEAEDLVSALRATVAALEEVWTT